LANLFTGYDTKHEKGTWNYTMHVLFASLQLYYVIYV
jgi:hypothetical protein